MSSMMTATRRMTSGPLSGADFTQWELIHDADLGEVSLDESDFDTRQDSSSAGASSSSGASAVDKGRSMVFVPFGTSLRKKVLPCLVGKRSSAEEVSAIASSLFVCTRSVRKSAAKVEELFSPCKLNGR